LAFVTTQTAFCEFCPAGALFKGSTGHVVALSVPVSIAVFFIVFAYGRKTWCSYLCPLGAFFGLFSRIQFFGIRAEKDKCIKCFMCNKSCPMDVLVVERYINKGMKINDGDCIKCMNCVDACPRKILKFP
jgi:ferredoxin-type protein NapH